MCVQEHSRNSKHKLFTSIHVRTGIIPQFYITLLKKKPFIPLIYVVPEKKTTFSEGVRRRPA